MSFSATGRGNLDPMDSIRQDSGIDRQLQPVVMQRSVDLYV
jgi:hypothetical protein